MARNQEIANKIFAFSYGFDRWANSALVSYVIQDLAEGPVGRMCNNAQPLGDLN